MSASGKKSSASPSKQLNWKDLQLRYANPRTKELTLQLKSQILEVLKAMNGHSSITVAAIDNLCGMLMHMTDQILSEAESLRLAHYPNKEFITEQDIAKALQMLVGGHTYQVMSARAEYVCQTLREHEAEKKKRKQS